MTKKFGNNKQELIDAAIAGKPVGFDLPDGLSATMIGDKITVSQNTMVVSELTIEEVRLLAQPFRLLLEIHDGKT